MKRGTIEQARMLCEEIAGELRDGEQYGSVDVAEILSAEVERLREALVTIAGGYTHRFPGAPDPMTATSPHHFRAEMWTWSQKAAKAALDINAATPAATEGSSK